MADSQHCSLVDVADSQDCSLVVVADSRDIHRAEAVVAIVDSDRTWVVVVATADSDHTLVVVRLQFAVAVVAVRNEL